MYAIKKGNLYTSKPGSHASYTKDICKAEKFTSKDAAMRNKCSNEYVVNVYDEVR